MTINDKPDKKPISLNVINEQAVLNDNMRLLLQEVIHLAQRELQSDEKRCKELLETIYRITEIRAFVLEHETDPTVGYYLFNTPQGKEYKKEIHITNNQLQVEFKKHMVDYMVNKILNEWE